jgi:mono/diheme cytochrome c family protein
LKFVFASFGITLATVIACAPAPETVSDEASGEVLAKRLCAGCHAVGVDDASRHSSAPPFRTLSDSYPVEYLAEALAEGIIVGHPDMPIFEMSPGQIDGFLLYLEDLQEAPSD